MYCTNCGSAIPGGATACTKCGTPVANVSSQANMTQNVAGQTPVNPMNYVNKTSSFLSSINSIISALRSIFRK